MTTEPGSERYAAVNVTVPVGQAVYEQYADSLALPGEKPRTHELSLNGMAVRGRWVLVAVRGDYAINGERTYWLTFSWAGE